MNRALLVPALCVALAPAAAIVRAAPACTARDPINAEVKAREGIRLAKAGQFEAAEALLLTATRLDPCTPKYHYLLGRAHDRQDEYDAAAAAYQTVIAGFPTSIEFTKAQGASVKMQARRAAAEKAAAEKAAAEKAAAERAAREKAAAEKAAAEKAAAEKAAREKAAAEQAAAEQAAREKATPGDTTTIAGPTTVGDTPWAAIGWLTAGLGIAAIGAGVGFSAAARSADDELALAATRPDRSRYDALLDERDTFSTLGWAGYGVGAALVIGGLTMVIVDEDPALAVTPTRGGAVMGFTGHF